MSLPPVLTPTCPTKVFSWKNSFATFPDQLVCAARTIEMISPYFERKSFEYAPNAPPSLFPPDCICLMGAISSARTNRHKLPLVPQRILLRTDILLHSEKGKKSKNSTKFQLDKPPFWVYLTRKLCEPFWNVCTPFCRQTTGLTERDILYGFGVTQEKASSNSECFSG